jgi:hypothetical protein
MINQENIKTFVRQTLGCGCPEEVFERINCQIDVALDEKILLRTKLSVGNRLLVYIFEPGNSDSLDFVIPFLVDSGRKERDTLGFNRLRIVLTSDDTGLIKKTASEIFEKTQKDEKIHLHIIERHAIPDFL